MLGREGQLRRKCYKRQSGFQTSPFDILKHHRAQFRHEKIGVPEGEREVGKQGAQKVVENTFKGDTKATRKAYEDFSLSVNKEIDVERIIEEVLKQKKIVSSKKEVLSARFIFTQDKLEKPLSKRLKMPQPPSFSGLGDPNKNIQNYEAIMLFHGWEDAIM